MMWVEISYLYYVQSKGFQSNKKMSLSFAERLSKIKRNQDPITPLRKPKQGSQKFGSAKASQEVSHFQQHHSDLKSMLQMLECQKINSVFTTPVRNKCSSSQEKTVGKAKTEGRESKENSKKTELPLNGPDRKLKIKFKNNEEDNHFFETPKPTLLLKNLQFKNKTSRHQEQSVSKNNPNACGKRGIPNIGNTCYMNAVLQCLFHLKDFSRSLTCSQNQSKYPVTLKYLSLFNGVTNALEKSPDLSTMPLKKSVSKMCCLFMDFEQEDAHEFLKQLLDSIHKEINRVKKSAAYRVMDFSDRKENLLGLSHEYWNENKKFDDSYIYDSLCGQVCNYVTCVNCQNTSVNFDNFLDLSLPLVKGANSLESLLKEYFGEESLSDFYVCSKCGKSSKKSMKRSELWRCPNYIIIQLKRSQFGKKNSEKIKIPVKCLDMRPFMTPTNKPVSCKYNLQGVVLHRGRSDGGHYWANIKDGSNWYSADDQSIVSQPIDEVVRGYEETGSDSAYILFYRSI